MTTSKWDFERKSDIRGNEFIKETLEDGTINMYFTSQDSRTRTSFASAAEYMNGLLEDGYEIANIEDDTSGDYASYTNDHRYVVFKDGKFSEGRAPTGDCPHYDHEWIKYTLAKPNEDAELKAGQEVEVILWNRDNEDTLRVGKKTVEQNLGGFVTFENDKSKYELPDTSGDVDDLFKLYKQGYGAERLVVSPDQYFTQRYIKAFEKAKREKLEKQIEMKKKALKELEEELEAGINVNYDA